MKKVFTLYFLLASLIPLLQAQSQEGGGLLFFEKIIICEGKEREILFQQLTGAFSEIYDSTNVLITNEDQILTIGSFNIRNRLVGKVGNPAGRIDFTLTIDVKDEKYRYRATDFYFTPIEKDRYGRFHISDEPPVMIDEANLNASLLKKVKLQGSEYLKKLEKLLNDQLVNTENNEEW